MGLEGSGWLVAVAPRLVEYVPASQFVHCEAEDDAENVPALHVRHSVDAADAYCPALHAIHVLEGTAEAVPAAHALHVPDRESDH